MYYKCPICKSYMTCVEPELHRCLICNAEFTEEFSVNLQDSYMMNTSKLSATKYSDYLRDRCKRSRKLPTCVGTNYEAGDNSLGSIVTLDKSL